MPAPEGAPARGEGTAATDAPAASPTGYTLIPPPGWELIPLREGTEEALRALVDGAVRDLPEELPRDRRTEARMALHKELHQAVRQAREAHAHSLYLPVRRVRGHLLAASFVVSERLRAPGSGPRDDLVAGLLRSPGAGREAEATEVDGAPGVRTEGVVAADPARGVEHDSRHVDYVFPVPGPEGGRWVTVSFSVLTGEGPHGELADALVGLFDAVMTTFRWRYA
ncbi:hypothetical protein [Streptomyces sp. NPDC058374]|uniref:hypothetical protein n=1 Tax=unclassified Streptomyces TaxID=2593676 RepID=UPI00365C30C3